MMSEDLSNVEEIPSPVDQKALCQGSLLIVGSAHCARKFDCWLNSLYFLFLSILQKNV